MDIFSLAASAVLGASPVPAPADTVNQPDPVAAPAPAGSAPAAAAATDPGEIAPPPSSGSSGDSHSLEIYGFAQFDAIQDFDRVNPDWEAALRPSRIPTVKGQYGSDGQSILSIKQSR